MNDAFVDLPDPSHARLNVSQKGARTALFGVAVNSAVQDLKLHSSGRQLVQLLPALELEAMLNLPQELIGLCQLVKVFAAEMTLVVQLLQGEQGTART